MTKTIYVLCWKLLLCLAEHNSFAVSMSILMSNTNNFQNQSYNVFENIVYFGLSETFLIFHEQLKSFLA